VRSLIKLPIKLLACAATLAAAGPVDFGLAELHSALSARNLKWKVNTELSLDPPENFRIEPYSAGGAHISGGDLRGLMYGLIEAAEQIRDTGRLKPIHGVPSAPQRAIRVFYRSADSEDFWRASLQMLARNRFNRVNLIFTSETPELAPPYTMLRFISQTAADYGIDFSLGIWDLAILGPDSHDALSKLIAACPMIRGIQLRSDEGSSIPSDVLQALREAGRRVTLDPRGQFSQPSALKTAKDAGVALLRSPLPWPPGFEVDPPLDHPLDHDRWEPARHPPFYWLWGRVGYDPKIKLPKGADASEFQAAIQARNQLAIAQVDVAPGDWGFVTSVPEAVHNRLERIPSARQTPVETADLLEAAASRLVNSRVPDFRLLASQARDQARMLSEAYQIELTRQSPGEMPPPRPSLPRPQFEHRPSALTPPNQPLDVTLRVAPPKDARTVRIYYRALSQSADFKMMEKPAAAAVTFTIPASDIAKDGDLLYYFEILNREDSGWFEPDPFSAKPFYVVKVAPPEPAAQ
jgi:hypothetical protein